MRAWRRRRRARVSLAQETWRGAIEAARLDPQGGELPRLTRLDLPEFLLAWNRAQDDASRDNLAQLARRHGIDGRSLELLRTGTLRSRLIAITALGHLREERAWDALERLARHGGPVVSFAAARALLRIEPRRALDALAATIVQRTDWPVARLGRVFAELGPAIVTPTLTTMLVARQRSGLDRVVKLAKFGDRARVAPIVRGWLSASDDADVIMAALDYVDDAQELAWVRQAAVHEEWRVRMSAAKALGRIGASGELEALLELLRDPVWWVRYHAAQAVTRLKGMTQEQLVLLQENARDHFAADMLAHALAVMPARRNPI